jgi:ABC-type transporter Mla MlaB component
MGPGRPRRRAEVVDIDLDVSWLVPADLGAVDALARLQVTASRCGRSLQLHGACGGLPELLEFLGLVDVLHLCACCGPGAGAPGPSSDG